MTATQPQGTEPDGVEAGAPASFAVRCRALTKHYPSKAGPVRAVNGLDLEIRRGECFGLLGPNGCAAGWRLSTRAG